MSDIRQKERVLKMAKAKITVTGTVEKKPKINQDGTVDLVLKGSMSAMVPKGLKALGDTFILVHIGPKTWKKVSAAYQDDSFLIIQGEPKASKNNAGTPFIEVVCFDISLRSVTSDNVDPAAQDKKAAVAEIIQVVQERKPAANPKSVQKVQEDPHPGAAEYTNKKPKFKSLVWFSPEEVIDVPVNDVYLVERTHLITKSIDFQGMLKLVSETGILTAPIAVKPLDDRPGKYGLVMGMKTLMIAKLLNFEKVKAVVRDMEHKTLMGTLGINEDLKED